MRIERAPWRAVVLAVAVAALAGCGAGRSGPPRIALGTPCAACGMRIQDLRFACERPVADGWRVYDSIECLVGDTHGVAPTDAYLADYDSQTLHAVGSVWVVQGSFPSPMGGGYAAFVSREAADGIAAQSQGRVGRLQDFTGGVTGR